MERLAKHPTADTQEELLKHHCTEAESLIRSAATPNEARKLGEEVCGKFQKQCESILVLNATRTYIDNIIKSMFQGKA